MNREADDIIYRIQLAADSLTYIAYGLEMQISGDCEEANAVHYMAHALREDVTKLRAIYEAGE